jgi:hypothetical protein
MRNRLGYGLPSIADKMSAIIGKFKDGRIDGTFDLLEAVEKAFPHWTTKMILQYSARYLRKAGDNDTADAILVETGLEA